MTSTKLFLFRMAVVFFPLGAYAQEQNITLQEAIFLSIENQPSLAQVRADIELAEARKAQLLVAKKPQVDFNAAAGLEPPRRQDEAILIPGYSTSISLNWLLSDFGKTSTRVEAADAAISATALQLTTTQAELAFNVAQAYYALWTAQQSLALTEEALKEATARVDTAKALYESGVRPKIEVARAEVDRGNAEVQKVRAQGEVQKARVALATAIGQPGARYNAVEPPSLATPMDVQQALELALSSRPEIAALDAQISAQQKQIRVAQMGKRPDLFTRSSVSLVGPAELDGKTRPFFPTFSAQLVFSLPLYDGGAAASQEAIAIAQLHSLEAQRDLLKLSLGSDIETAYIEYQTAVAARIAAEEATRLAAENEALAKARYAAGAGSAIEISDAEVALVQAKSFELNARAQEGLARLRIEFVLGSLQK